MNSLSWFIYFAEVAGNVSAGITAVSIIALVVVGCSAIPALIDCMGDGEFYDKVWRPTAKWLVPCALLGLLTAAIIPSQRTLIMIAGSELGERVAKSDGVNSIVNPGMDLIRKWIKQEADKISETSKK
jgi:hypothetical protein